MVLACDNCGSRALEITSQSYSEDNRRAFESYECEHCGATGTLTHDETTGTTLDGDLTSVDDGRW